MNFDDLHDSELEICLRAMCRLGRPVSIYEAHVLADDGVIGPIDPLLDYERLRGQERSCPGGTPGEERA
ncbi:hypothetical protein [Rubrivirga litoralis]|uniref:Uncharacterized protein n=1 Tax=Rubrivirga litoralis TaxID=3075598 RepID=A0ABU3BUG5_9BACT|nr:hypothetical protein [Rubrivirga sp. F394]MDT0632936.1 hypothetical protein [Rubrivirga sp. F394]